jgi:hypothetical protein
MTNDEQYIGEIIEASTSEFTAESRELYSPPRFGSFVKVTTDAGTEAEIHYPGPAADPDDPFAFRSAEGSFSAHYDAVMDGKPMDRPYGLKPAIYAVVHSASTISTEPGRQPRAYWKDEEQLAREQPELSEWLLVTKFQAIIIGYGRNGSIRQYLPPQPPKIHTRVYECAPEEIGLLTGRLDFIRTLINSHSAPSDEVVAACIREAAAARGWDEEVIVAAGKELASLLTDDYERLQAIMRRVMP